MTTTSAQRTELAYRSSNGIEVSLFWSQASKRVTVEVLEEHIAQRIEFEVDPAKALDAFNHPYSYAAAPGLSVRASKSEAHLATTRHRIERKP